MILYRRVCPALKEIVSVIALKTVIIAVADQICMIISGQDGMDKVTGRALLFEFIIHTWIPEWKTRLAINFEDNALVTPRGVEALYPRNEKMILIR